MMRLNMTRIEIVLCAAVLISGCSYYGDKFPKLSSDTIGNNCSPTLMGGAVNCELSLSFNVSTIGGPAAGTILTGDTDAGSNLSRFNLPSGITTDGLNLYIADTSNNKIRKLVLATGQVTTIGGPLPGTTTGGDTDNTSNAALFTQPIAITTDGSNLFIADANNNKIRRMVISSGVVTTLAGPGPGCAFTCPASDGDGTGTIARFSSPDGIYTDGTSVYVSDRLNNKIRKITISTGLVSTIAGPAAGTTTAGDADGVGNAASFNEPRGITGDGTYLYVADSLNRKIRKILIASGAVTTIAGPAAGCYPSCTNADTDGTGSSARFGQPWGITNDGTNLYVADALGNKLRKIVIQSGLVTTVAGPSSGSTSNGDLDGNGNSSRFSQPRQITANASGLYVADDLNRKIRAIQ
jgi:hypothetical protein